MASKLVLGREPESLRTQYASASPFPHAVLDGLFEDAVLEGVLEDFPAPEATSWRRFDNEREKKLGFEWGKTEVSPRIRAFLDGLNSPPALAFLEALTGEGPLVPDPRFGGGGLHQIEPGGFLAVHADFNWHPELRLYRRLNMLVYLNRGWREEWGGHLELWDARMTGPVRRILPVFNRTVVFSTDDESFHGHPQPLACPPGFSRKSVSLYYYTAKPPAGASEPHDTVFPTSHRSL